MGSKSNWVSLITAIISLIAVLVSHISTNTKVDAKSDLATVQKTYEAIAPVVNQLADAVEVMHSEMVTTKAAANGEPEPAAVEPTTTATTTPPVVAPGTAAPGTGAPVVAPVPPPAPPAPPAPPVEFKLKRLPVDFKLFMQQSVEVPPVLPPVPAPAPGSAAPTK